MKLVGFIVLTAVLFSSLFKVAGAELTNNIAAVALMVLLLSLFSDLSEFNFWGLIGKRMQQEKELREVKGKEAIEEKKAPKVKKMSLRHAIENTEEVSMSMSSKRENFLEIAFAIEKQLRVAATVLSDSDTTTDMNPEQISRFLHEKGLLTDDGLRQIELIRSIRNDIVRGKLSDVGNLNLNLGLDVSHQLYMEMREWIEKSKS